MTTPPRKYSVNDDLQLPYGRRIGPKLNVYLNGRAATLVVSYDIDKGILERFVEAKDGGVVVDRAKGEAVTETLHGDVTVDWRETADAG